MSAATPWMKFYPQDWRADEKLRLCSLAARGLWIEMLAIMHRSERYGHLLIAGRVPTDAQLAVQVGASPQQVSECLGELDSAGVFSRAASGAIYSRRMTRDHKKAQTARKNGKNGGNPSLCKNGEKSASVKGEDKGVDKPQKPETRYSDTNVSGEPPPDPVKLVFDLGVSILAACGHDERAARKIIGMWRKSNRDADVMQALLDCRAQAISNPVEWVPKRLGNGGTASFSDHMRQKYAA